MTEELFIFNIVHSGDPFPVVTQRSERPSWPPPAEQTKPQFEGFHPGFSPGTGEKFPASTDDMKLCNDAALLMTYMTL